MSQSPTLIARLRHSTFAKDTAVLTMGTVGAQLLMIAGMPVMSRLYTPADFGLLALFTAVSSIIATFVTLRYETAILLPKKESEADTVVLVTLALALTLSPLIGFLAWLIPERLRDLIGVGGLENWLVIAALAGLANALIATGMAWLNRQRAYGKMAKLRITQSAIAVFAGISFGFSGSGKALLLAQIIALLVVSLMIMAHLRPLIAQWGRRAIVERAKEHQAAPRYLLPTALLDVVTMQLPVLLITAWFSSEAAGQFSMAWRILALPMTFVGGAVGQVFFQRFAQSWPNARAARKLLVKTWIVLGLIGLVPTALLMAMGEPIFAWMLGDEWRESGTMAAVIAPMLLAMLVSSPTSTTFLVLGLQKYSLFFGLAFLVYRSACIYFGAISDQLVLGIGAWVVCEIIAIISYNLIVWRHIGAHEVS